MPVTATLLHDGARYGGKSGERLYVIEGTADEAAALTALNTEAPAALGALVRTDTEVEPSCVDEDNGDASRWLGRASYSQRPAVSYPATGTSETSFDVTGQGMTVFHSLNTIASYKATWWAGDAPDYEGAINVTGCGKDQRIEGVDNTPHAALEWQETHYKPAGFVTVSYLAALRDSVWSVNNAAFKGFAAGEVIFLRATGVNRGGGDWSITFRFGVSPNRTNLTVGTITVAAKLGWHYLWVRYWPRKHAGSKTIVQSPAAAYVERIHETFDFAGYGIGTT